MTASYLELRQRTQARDRSLRQKVISLDEACELVKDGDHVALGWVHRVTYPDCNDLGADPREQEETDGFPEYRLYRG